MLRILLRTEAGLQQTARQPQRPAVPDVSPGQQLFAKHLSEAALYFHFFLNLFSPVNLFLFSFLHIYLFGCAGSSLWHVGSGPLTTPGPCMGSAESEPLGHRGNPSFLFFKILLMYS